MRYRRLPIEVESPEQLGYSAIRYNLSESSYRDMTLAELGVDGDVGDLVLQYGDHLGLPRLRELIAAGGSGTALHPDQVMVTAGAVAALFIVHTAVLQPGSHAVVVRPNYATNVETPQAIGAEVAFLDLRFEDGWRLDPDRLAAALRPQTALVSICLPHNPTGQTMTEPELTALVALVERHGRARLLVDETYRELAYTSPLPMAATLSDRVIAVSSLSKSFGLPGLRVGWISCRDEQLQTTLLAAKEQILISGATIDETLAARVLERGDNLLARIRAAVLEHRDLVAGFIAGQDVFEWVPPRAGAVCFPRVRAQYRLDADRFYADLLDRHGTYVGPGHWFGQDRRGFRLGFAWPTTDELRGGLAGLQAAARQATTAG
jgi:aspartate/methionine/tyrosine aminotransferase